MSDDQGQSSSENGGGSLSTVMREGSKAATEAAKALQEQEKTVQKALDLVQRAGSYVGGIFEVAASELSHLLGDRMRFWRFQNAVNILEKTEQIIRERGLTPDKLRMLGFGDGIRLLEAASLEETDDVQELWARLIANAADPAKRTTVKKVYVEILTSLSSAEVAFLDLLYECEKRNRFKNRQDVLAFNRDMNELAQKRWRLIAHVDQSATIQNLVRLRCITFRPRPIAIGTMFAALPDEGGVGSSFGFRASRWAAVDPEAFQKLIEGLEELLMVAAGVRDYKQSAKFPLSYSTGFGANVSSAMGSIEVPEMSFMLTPLGTALMGACERHAAGRTVESSPPGAL